MHRGAAWRPSPAAASQPRASLPMACAAPPPNAVETSEGGSGSYPHQDGRGENRLELKRDRSCRRSGWLGRRWRGWTLVPSDAGR
eukprot:5852955-Prymnesium_polylepis.1